MQVANTARTILVFGHTDKDSCGHGFLMFDLADR